MTTKKTTSRSVEQLIRRAKQSKLLREEMMENRDKLLIWLDQMGFQELIPALREIQEIVGHYKLIGQLTSAVFGGEGDNFEYDGLEDITFEELSEALQCLKEGHMSIRDCIKAMRFEEKKNNINTGF